VGYSKGEMYKTPSAFHSNLARESHFDFSKEFEIYKEKNGKNFTV
jgi:hypothetical protein